MRLVVVALTVLLLVTGCGKDDEAERQERAEARAAEARTQIDDLASRVGETTEVLTDELIDCIPGQEDSGIDLVYQLGVDTEGDPEQIISEVSDQMADEGWKVKRDPDGNGSVKVRFGKDGISMGARISTISGLAPVSGSGGCVQ